MEECEGLFEELRRSVDTKEVNVVQLCGHIDDSTASIFLVKETDQIVNKMGFGEALLNHMIDIGTTTDVLSIGFVGDQQGKVTDIAIVIHPECSLERAYAEERLPTFLQAPPDRILYYTILYSITDNRYTIEAAQTCS